MSAAREEDSRLSGGQTQTRLSDLERLHYRRCGYCQAGRKFEIPGIPNSVIDELLEVAVLEDLDIFLVMTSLLPDFPESVLDAKIQGRE